MVPDAPIAGNTTGFLSECGTLPDTQKGRCYVRGLLREVEQVGQPGHGRPGDRREGPRRRGFLEAACHSLMHEVGRTWARQHDLTLEDLYRYVPRSNDPGCSAGFGMGLAMYLGPQLVTDPTQVLATCTALPTRFREYTCVHGLGHAFMRGFHGYLRDAVTACNKLGDGLRPGLLAGCLPRLLDLAGRRRRDRAARAGGRGSRVGVRRVHVQAAVLVPVLLGARGIEARLRGLRTSSTLCKDEGGMQRAGCVSGASLLVSRERDPVDHARVCTALQGVDTYNCLRGVNVPALDGRTFEQLRLVRTCGDLPSETSAWCYRWFGQDARGRHRRGVPRAGMHAARGRVRRRAVCARGRPHGLPLRTFS